MKKKRSGKKKGGSSGGSKADAPSESTSIPKDKHHNWSRPCTDIAAAITQENLPALPGICGRIEIDAATEAAATTKTECLCVYCNLALDKDSVGKALTTGNLLLTQQPLLAFIILRHLIEERKQTREDERQGGEHHELTTLLDAYIDSNEASNIIDKGTIKWGNRDLDTFAAFLKQKFECHAKKYKNKSDALRMKDILPTISINEANDILNSIECRSCRTAATSHLQCLIGEQSSIVLNEGGAVVGHMNMIEAGGSTEGRDVSSFQLELYPICHGSETVTHLQAGSYLDGHTVNTHDITGLVKQIILPRHKGTDYKQDDHDGLGDNELTKIAKAALASVNNIEKNFNRINSDIVPIHTELENMNIAALDKDKTDLNDAEFDAANKEVRKKLNNYNAACDALMKKIGNVIHILFKLTSYVCWSKEYGPDLLAHFQGIWKRYNSALSYIMQPVFNGRSKLSHILSKHIHLPNERRCNCMKRLGENLLELARVKVGAINKLVVELSSCIKGPSDAPSPMLVLCVLCEYRRHVEGYKKIEVFPNQHEEDLLLQLILECINLSMSTSITPLVHMQEKYTEKITSITKNIRIRIHAGDNLAIVDFLGKAYKANENAYYSIQIQQSGGRIDDNDGSNELQKSVKEFGDASILLGRSFWIVMQWLTAISLQQCKETAMETLLLPPRLATWLDSTRGTNVEQANNLQKMCRGGGGECRISSIITSLIYRWLESRCSEWHAELLADELVKLEEPPVASRKKDRKSKKKSKRASTQLSTQLSTQSSSDDIKESGCTDSAKSSPENVFTDSKANDNEDDSEANSSSSSKAQEKSVSHVMDTPDSGSLISEESTALPDESITVDTNNGTSRQNTTGYVASLRCRIREQFIGKDKSVVDNCIEQNANAIQAILASNEEIYDRCKGCIADGTSEKTTFIKPDFEVVDAYYDQTTAMFHFVTYPEHCRKELDTKPLSNLPSSLDFGAFTFRQMYIGTDSSHASSFINYRTLFESSFMFHDDFLGLFLVKLKEHLENVTACLKEIDDWLSTPFSNMKYLQQHFGKEKLEYSNMSIKHFCIEGSHSDDDLCLQCDCVFSQHDVDPRKVQGTEGQHRRLCPQAENTDLPYFTCGRCNGIDSGTTCPHYMVEKTFVLQKITCNRSFDPTFSMSFDISEEQGRIQLSNFGGFIEGIVTN